MSSSILFYEMSFSIFFQLLLNNISDFSPKASLFSLDLYALGKYQRPSTLEMFIFVESKYSRLFGKIFFSSMNEFVGKNYFGGKMLSKFIDTFLSHLEKKNIYSLKYTLCKLFGSIFIYIYIF